MESLYLHAARAAEEYYQNKLKQDPTINREDTTHDWNVRYWWSWCCERFIEHLCGQTQYKEFGADDFSLLEHDSPAAEKRRQELRELHQNLKNRIASKQAMEGDNNLLRLIENTIEASPTA